MRLRHFVPALAVLLLPAPAALHAQTVQGRLLEAETGTPITGAFVQLLDAHGTRRAATLTTQDGAFVLRAPGAGSYALVAEQIGKRDVRTEAFTLGSRQTLTRTLSAAAEVFTLEGIRVEGDDRRCALRADAAQGTAAVWEEARKALDVAAWAESQGVLHYETTSYVRRLHPQSLRVLEQEVHERTGFHSDGPFASRPARVLADSGYAVLRADGSGTYYAPDADVLLSDAFLDGHCMHLVRGEDEEEGLIGLAFRPVDRSGERPDIEGTLWLEPQTAALRFLEYGYTGLRLRVSDHHVGGRVEFGRVPGGTWIVRRWWIRMPEIGVRRLLSGGAIREALELVALRQAGGEVVAVRTLAGEILKAGPPP